MKRLNLPNYNIKRRNINNREEIFDLFRKKWVKLTPEEWVRQNFLIWLTSEKKYPYGLIAVERSLTVNKMPRRFDAVIFNIYGKAQILLEFKSPEVKLSTKVFDQIAAYNTTIKAKYLIISNGMIHYCVKTNNKNMGYTFLSEIPEYVKL